MAPGVEYSFEISSGSGKDVLLLLGGLEAGFGNMVSWALSPGRLAISVCFGAVVVTRTAHRGYRSSARIDLTFKSIGMLRAVNLMPRDSNLFSYLLL